MMVCGEVHQSMFVTFDGPAMHAAFKSLSRSTTGFVRDTEYSFPHLRGLRRRDDHEHDAGAAGGPRPVPRLTMCG